MTPEAALAAMDLAFLRLRVRFACHEMNNFITQISGQATLTKMAAARGEDITERLGRLSEASNDLASEVRMLHQGASSETAQSAGESLKSLRDEARSLIRSGRGARDVVHVAADPDDVWDQSASIPSRTLLMAVYLSTEALLTEADEDAVVTFGLDQHDGGMRWTCRLADSPAPQPESPARLALTALGYHDAIRIEELEEEGTGTGLSIWLTCPASE